MKTLMLINDSSPEAEHALAYAMVLAKGIKGKILVWNKTLQQPSTVATQLVTVNRISENKPQNNSIEQAKLKTLNWKDADPDVLFLDDVQTSDQSIHTLVNQFNVDLILKGISNSNSNLSSIISGIITKTTVPLLIIPLSTTLKIPSHIAYITDLRYCRKEPLSFTSKIATMLDKEATIAHLSAGNLLPLQNDYADRLFEENTRQFHKAKLRFNHIKNSDVKLAVDVLTSVLQIDLLIMTYNRYHYNNLTTKPAMLHVPIVLFPS